MNIEEQIAALMEAPDAAPEVVTLDRSTVEAMLSELETTNPLRSLVIELRAKLAEPYVQLWAMHVLGPDDVYPALDKEHAERMVADLLESMERHKQKMVERGEGLEHWFDCEAKVIPSPWIPEDHYRCLAENALEEEEILRNSLRERNEHRSKLLAAIQPFCDLAVAFDGGEQIDNELTVEQLREARQVMLHVTEGERLRDAHLRRMSETYGEAAEQSIEAAKLAAKDS
ncbi:hypothetical protein [Stutzerimonas nitrititolerans]|uniref:hypothetical protein n=1 Tax=Stutzerimonas nitrititolerans TaxID=2482751 RepID=UPI0028AAB934|nr:hypothetical protein [Stutzerimonas nitrititolerans]